MYNFSNRHLCTEGRIFRFSFGIGGVIWFTIFIRPSRYDCSAGSGWSRSPGQRLTRSRLVPGKTPAAVAKTLWISYKIDPGPALNPRPADNVCISVSFIPPTFTSNSLKLFYDKYLFNYIISLRRRTRAQSIFISVQRYFITLKL